jgi:hypothetical protein
MMMKQFEENYAVRDKQDVLAICAYNLLASQSENKKILMQLVRNNGTIIKKFLTTSRQISHNKTFFKETKILPTLVHNW